MNELIELNKYPVKEVLPLLLKDKTTGKNIVFATDTYSKYEFYENDEITVGALLGFESCDIQPRVFKDQSEQTDRTRKKAEVFSPTWICNKMNSHCDSDWFEREDVFNTPKDQLWNTITEKISFSDKKDWKKYVDSRRLEITCGEAPYIVSRYDATTGEPIETKDRIGFLDRKIRIVSENTVTEEEWIEWATRAVQSVYGYEFQGDNLLIARINILITFCDYYYKKWGKEVGTDVLKKIANIISWNFWQMDGLTNSVPEFKDEEQFVQMALFDIGTEPESSESKQLCKIQNWRKEAPLLFDDIQSKKRGKTMKFDYVIGNPPYQEEQVSNDIESSQKNFAPSIYNLFMDSAFDIGSKVELIHPARFLFNAGNTPKAWNEKMLNDEHFKVLSYSPDSSDIFPTLSTPLKGGIAITYRDQSKSYGAIKAFTQYREVNTVLHKVTETYNFKSLVDIVFSRTAYRLTDKMHSDYPEAKDLLSNGHLYDMASNIFDRLPFIFYDEEPNDGIEYIRVLGREDSRRVYKYIRKEYVNDVENLNYYKVLVPQANGSGLFGEVMSATIVEGPNTGNTETFISIGKAETKEEADAIQKYIHTKFARTLLGVLKVTQNGNKPVWRYIPLQDFTSSSDIDWSKSIAEIDQQLYRKYGLSDEEIEFIETHVKEMN